MEQAHLQLQEEGGRIILECIIIGLVAFLIIFVYIKADDIITGKRLRENRLAWNEYSKNMTDYEKEEVYLKWCKQRKLEKGWNYYYFP